MGDCSNGPSIGGSDTDREGIVTTESGKLKKAASQQEPLITSTITKGPIKANLEKGRSGPRGGKDFGSVGGDIRTPWNQILSSGKSSNTAEQMKLRYIEPIKRDSRIIV
ncbi:unnamed protein product [Ilex paraguariensis]|uniref:Uncharacterized protein n=1 Tax=Ilex paraguariensis TaxID=185542 RepID=A0ABC8QMI0_9AQUA